MKDPVMSTIFDYLIQPMIIKEGVTPLGSFGSPLYRSDAGAISKTGSFTRTLSESVVPNVWGLPAGLGTRMIEGTIPGTEGLTSALPSYKGQQLSHALVGENRQGISGQEPAGSRTLRTVLGGLGVPVQTPVSFTNLPKDLKNKLK
jgi:hypothetical protein